MKKGLNLIKDILVFSLFLICCPVQAFAYLDAGTISVFLQGLLASVAIGYIVIKNFIINKTSKLYKFFSKTFLKSKFNLPKSKK